MRKRHVRNITKNLSWLRWQNSCGAQRCHYFLSIAFEKELRCCSSSLVRSLRNQTPLDAFAKATEVVSIITSSGDRLIIKPSSFCRLFRDIIRKKENSHFGSSKNLFVSHWGGKKFKCRL